MLVQQLCWALWIGGPSLIVLSWLNAVPVEVGWLGFAVSMVGAVISYIPRKEARHFYPLTQEGFPVEPSGAPVPADMALPPGTPLLAFSQGRWWRATVIAVEENGEIEVGFPGWDPDWRERFPASSSKSTQTPCARLSGSRPKVGWTANKSSRNWTGSSRRPRMMA